MDLRRKTLLLIGPKRSGLSVAHFAARPGVRVCVVDRRSAEDLSPACASVGQFIDYARRGKELAECVDLV